MLLFLFTVLAEEKLDQQKSSLWRRNLLEPVECKMNTLLFSFRTMAGCFTHRL